MAILFLFAIYNYIELQKLKFVVEELKTQNTLLMQIITELKQTNSELYAKNLSNKDHTELYVGIAKWVCVAVLTITILCYLSGSSPDFGSIGGTINEKIGDIGSGISRNIDSVADVLKDVIQPTPLKELQFTEMIEEVLCQINVILNGNSGEYYLAVRPVNDPTADFLELGVYINKIFHQANNLRTQHVPDLYGQTALTIFQNTLEINPELGLLVVS